MAAEHRVAGHLGVAADDYDQTIRTFIPNYELMLETIVHWLAGRDMQPRAYHRRHDLRARTPTRNEVSRRRQCTLTGAVWQWRSMRWTRAPGSGGFAR